MNAAELGIPSPPASLESESPAAAHSASPNAVGIPPPNSFYQAWSRSYVEMYTIAHEWTIENFVELDEEATIIFKIAIEGNEELKFKLSLKPRYGENRDYISLYVHNLNKKDLKYRLVFNIVDAFKEKKLTRRADARLHAPNESWGFPKFCQRTDVVDKPESMLPDGVLTVLCEIGGFKKITNRSDYQRVREEFDSGACAALPKDMALAFENMEHSDFLLVVGEKEFPCHRFMLSARSDVFKAMFQHADLKENREGKLHLDGDTSVSPAVVSQFLKFVYTDSITDHSFGTISHLLPLAEKYNIKKLSTMCGEYLLGSMTIENVSEIAVLGSLYEVPLLRTKAIEYISKYPEQIMKTEGWKELLKLSPEVCTSIIYRLSRVCSDKEVVLKSSTRSSLSN